MLSRRRVLVTSNLVWLSGLTGCSGITNSDPSTNHAHEYPELNETEIYVAEDVGLRLPKDTTQVDEPGNAELIILHGNLAVAPAQVVTWLTQDRVIALLGDRAQQSWLDVVQSDPYRAAFESEGYGVGEPAPHLLIAVAIENRTTSYRKSWGNQPGNDDLLATLDETMADISSRKADQTE